MNPTLTLDEQVCECLKVIKQSIWLWILNYCKLIQTWKGKHNGSCEHETHTHKGKKVHTWIRQHGNL